jgi:hypothetical protein
MRDLLIEAQPGKPAPRQMLLDQLALAADAIQIADQQDAQQKLLLARNWRDDLELDAGPSKDLSPFTSTRFTLLGVGPAPRA